MCVIHNFVSICLVCCLMQRLQRRADAIFCVWHFTKLIEIITLTNHDCMCTLFHIIFYCIKFIFCLIYIYKEAFERSWRRERSSDKKKKPKWTNPFKYSTLLVFMTTKSSIKLAVAGKFTKFSRRSYMQWRRWMLRREAPKVSNTSLPSTS